MEILSSEKHNFSTPQAINLPVGMMELQTDLADRLNTRVAKLLNQDRGKFPFLTVDQCLGIIKTFQRMQAARDDEVYNLLKPLINRFRETVASLDTWRSMMTLPRSSLLKTLSAPVETSMGTKPRSYELEDSVLVAITVSNKILEALQFEEKTIGLSRKLALLQETIKKKMICIEEFLTNFLLHIQRSPSAVGQYFPPSKVGLRKALPGYIDPYEKLFKGASLKHPLVKTAGSEWNKWLKRHNTKFIRIDPGQSNACYMKIYVPEGPILELREAFKTAIEVEHAIAVERLQIAQGRLVPQTTHQTSTRLKAAAQTYDRVESLEDIDWDFMTYLRILDHKKVDYVRGEDHFKSMEPDEKFEDSPWSVSDREIRRFLYPNYIGPVISRYERVLHPADIEVFKRMNYGSNLPSVAAANAALSTSILDDDLTVDEMRDHAHDGADVPFDDNSLEWADKELSENPFVRDGLELDRRSETMRLATLFYWPPEYKGHGEVYW